MASKCCSISKLLDDTGHSEGVCGWRGGFGRAALGRNARDWAPMRGSVTGSLGSHWGKGRRNPICRTKVMLDTVTLCVVLVSAEHEFSVRILQRRTIRRVRLDLPRSRGLSLGFSFLTCTVRHNEGSADLSSEGQTVHAFGFACPAALSQPLAPAVLKRHHGQCMQHCVWLCSSEH